jgi:PPK2 family polyphosphate:nucleotide phosphotransferase
MKLGRALRVKPGSRVRLADRDPAWTAGIKDKKAGGERLAKITARLAELQYKLYADNRYALLVILQGMDAAGKDGTIRHVLSGVNPQGCRVTSFKVPTPLEADHDFLWRVHAEVPAFGEVGVFNRSHYEDVLVVRVRKLAPESVWSGRFRQINAFEKMLSQNRVKILKLFLHIGKEEQKERLLKRLKDPSRNWKFNPGDLEERKLWGAYMKAYEDVLSRCSTPCAPWYVIPADHKWFRNLAVAEILVEALESLDLRFPKPAKGLSRLRVV